MELDHFDWAAVVAALIGHGWVRLAGVIPTPLCQRLIDTAPGTWWPVPEHEPGGSVHVRQGGLSANADLSNTDRAMRSLADKISDGINNESRSIEVPALPPFNHAQWCRSNNGVKYITAHRDPPGAGGVIAIATLHGRAQFYVWDDTSDLPSWEHQRADAHSWQTGDGDLVLLRCYGWPTEESRCPVHEVESPVPGDRITLTLRHNRGGFGADYFA